MRGLLGSILDLGLHAESHLPSTVPRILICGDADFKYARALQSRLDALGGAGARGPQIFASAFEPEEELVSKYPDAAERMASLRADGAWVGCGVDARTLEAHFPNAPPWERIVFNLPQAPPMPKARNQIQRHRALLREFCASAASVLSPDGQLWITLLAGQGGTPLDLVAREEGNHWQLQREAARSGLLVAAVDLPDLGELEDSGYLPTGRGYRGRELGPRRQAQGLVTHVLVHEGRCPAVAPLEWAFDNSFWIDGEPMAESELQRIGREALGEAAHALVAPPTLLDAWTSPAGRSSRTYRFYYRSDQLALSRERALGFNAQLCEAIVGVKGATSRIPSAETLERVLEEAGQDGSGLLAGGAAQAGAAQEEAWQGEADRHVGSGEDTSKDGGQPGIPCTAAQESQIGDDTSKDGTPALGKYKEDGSTPALGTLSDSSTVGRGEGRAQGTAEGGTHAAKESASVSATVSQTGGWSCGGRWRQPPR